MGQNDYPYVLARFDVRGKQEFIFRSNRIKTIQGGSSTIEDIFDEYLYKIAETVDRDGNAGKTSLGIYHGEADGSLPPFDRVSFAEHLKEGYIGEIVYNGGGNLLVLFANEETFKTVNYLFSKQLTIDIGTLNVQGTCIGNIDFDCYERDRALLYQKHQSLKSMETLTAPWGMIPIVQVDPNTSFPLTHIRMSEENIPDKITKEDHAKYRKYKEDLSGSNKKDPKRSQTERILDHLVTEKGVESLLAIIYIDGNNMGARVKSSYSKDGSYEKCVGELRAFSDEIQKECITDRINEIDNELSENGQTEKWRIVVHAGDEISFVCNARDAFRIARNYLNNISKNSNNGVMYTSCAGIAVFHSHMPYIKAYQIAEECCSNAKKAMKKRKLTNACLLDFHFCQGAIGTDLDQIRRHENNEDCSKPWVVWCAEDEKDKCSDLVNTENLDAMVNYLQQLGRSNVKGLGEAARESEAALELDMLRIEAHAKDETKSGDPADGESEAAGKAQKLKEAKAGLKAQNLPSAMQRKLIYDIVPVYDIWFGQTN